MPKSLAIIRPWPVSAIVAPGSIQNPGNMLTPNPREVALVTAVGGAKNVDIDLGASRNIDSLFVGYHSAGAEASVYTVRIGNNADYSLNAPIATTPAGAAANLRAPSSSTEPVDRHGFFTFAPVAGRYVRVTFQLMATDFVVGVLALGKQTAPVWGHEYGSGRMVEDTSEVERLFGGGFGINQGAIAGGYQWTFGDLTDAELEDLYNLVRRLGSSRSVLVVEDPDNTTGLNERIHWGLFDRLEPYERLVPGASRWAFRVKDWA